MAQSTVSWEQSVARLQKLMAVCSEETPREPRRSAAIQAARRRLALGLSQAQVAERAGITQPMVARFERGADNFTIELLEKIAGALGCEVEIRLVPR